MNGSSTLAPHGQDQNEDCHCVVIMQDDEGFFAVVVTSCEKGCAPKIYSPWHEPTQEAATKRAERELTNARVAVTMKHVAAAKERMN